MRFLSKYLFILLLCMLSQLTCIHCTWHSENSDYSDVHKAVSAWPMVGHDLRHTCRSPYTGCQTGRIKWISEEAESRITGTPVLDIHGNILVGTWNTGLYCYSMDGKIIWRFPFNETIECVPAIAPDGTIYFGVVAIQTLIALYPNGTFKWSLGFGPVFASSPAIGPDGTVYIGGHNGCIHAINPDGSLKWVHCVSYVVDTSPAIDERGNIYIGAKNGILYCFHPSGKILWKYNSGHPIDSSVAIDEVLNRLYFHDGTKLIALDKSGLTIWQFPFTSYTVDTSPGIGNDGTIYLPCDDRFYALHPNGSVKWEQPIYSSKGFPAIGADDTVYVGGVSQDPVTKGFYNIHAIGPDGMFKWIDSCGNYSSPKNSPIIDYDGTVYFVTDKTITAFQDINNTPEFKE